MDSQQREQARWFAEQVQPHESALRSYLVGKFPALHDVDDLVQESFLRVLRAWARGSVTSSKALLFATARNLALDRIRHERVITFEPIAEESTSLVYIDAVDAAEASAKKQELELLTEAIQSLPNRCRHVLTLRGFYGLSQREIAHTLGISESGVEKQISKGLRLCAEFFALRGLP